MIRKTSVSFVKTDVFLLVRKKQAQDMGDDTIAGPIFGKFLKRLFTESAFL